MFSVVPLSRPQCHHQEPPNHVPHLEGGIRDSKLVCDRPFTPQLQYAEGTETHVCIVERNSPTSVRRRFSLTQEGLGRVIPGGEGPEDGINIWRRELFFCYSVFHLLSAQKAAVVLDLSRSFSSSSATGTKECRFEFSLLCSWCEQESIVLLVIWVHCSAG